VQSHVDSDHDRMSDALEQPLLVQFVPSFMVERQDYSNTPAEFRPDISTPEVKAENGTIYGQVFRAKTKPTAEPTAEIHFAFVLLPRMGSAVFPKAGISHLEEMRHANLRKRERTSRENESCRDCFPFPVLVQSPRLH